MLFLSTRERLGRTCTICSHPDLEAIDQALLARVPFRLIAEQRAVSASALIRHRDAHIPLELRQAKAATEVAQADALLAQVNVVLVRATAILDQAEEVGNLSAANGAIREVRGTIALLAKLAGELRDNPPVNITLTPEWRTMRTALVSALAVPGRQTCGVRQVARTRRRLLNLARDLAIALDPVGARNALSARADIPSLSPASFALAVSTGYKVPPHVDLLDQVMVETVVSGGLLLVTMPPRHGKSLLSSCYAPAWFLGTHPDRLLCSFDAELAGGFGRRGRDLLREHGERCFGVTVRSDSAAFDRWEIAGYKGGMLTAGVGGSITGRGADLLIIDDPIKSIEDSESELQRDKVWDWFRGVALPRLEPGAAVIVIMTRWHEDDLAGRILANDTAGRWRVLSLPALAEENDPLGRQPGDPLWPERYPVPVLKDRKREMGSRLFAAEYQQRPAPAEGAMFKREWIRYCRPVSKEVFELDGHIVNILECERLVTCDLAVSKANTADFTVIASWAITPKREMILVDLIRKRMEGPDIVPALRRVYGEFGPCAIGIEATGFQLTIVQEARRSGLEIIELRPDKDRVSRAHAATAKMERGEIFFRQGADYLDMLEAELLSFPVGKYDDQVDALSYAVAEVARRGVGDWLAAYGYSPCPGCHTPYNPRTARQCANCGIKLSEQAHQPEPFSPTAYLAQVRALGGSSPWLA